MYRVFGFVKRDIWKLSIQFTDSVHWRRFVIIIGANILGYIDLSLSYISRVEYALQGLGKAINKSSQSFWTGQLFPFHLSSSPLPVTIWHPPLYPLYPALSTSPSTIPTHCPFLPPLSSSLNSLWRYFNTIPQGNVIKVWWFFLWIVTTLL